MIRRQYSISSIALIAGPLVAAGFLILADLSPGNPLVTRTAAVAIIMAVWWITEAVPLAITALLPIVLYPVLGIMNGKTVAPIYFNHIILLFIGGFLVALAMQKWNLHKRIALHILLRFGGKPSRILMGFMTATAFLSMWISNTATTMMMVPIALAIVLRLEKLLGKEKARPINTGLFLGVAYSASIGGIATLVGTPPNLSFSRIFAISFPGAPEISFSTWFVFALPISLVFLIFLWGLLKFIFFRNEGEVHLDRKVYREQLSDLGRMSGAERIVLIDFTVMVLLWLFRSNLQLGGCTIPGWSNLFQFPAFFNDGTVAITMALLLFMIPDGTAEGSKILDWETATRLPWNIVLLFGGGFALASGFTESGLSIWIGETLKSAGDLHPIFLVMVICTAITFMTELTSNTATAEMLLPILAGLAVAIQVNPLLLMIPATLSCSFAFMLPVATPPNAIVFGSQRLKILEMARTGIWMNLAGILLITTAIFLIGRFVFGIDLAAVPDWAVAP